MRDIKFRAWDKKMKLFHHWNSVDQFYGNIFWKMIKDEKHPIMQYTGLKDKNRKEIYEGDIVKCDVFQREQEICIDKMIVVKFSEGSFYPFGYNSGWRSGVENIRIIGNIYENPELLKDGAE